MGGAPTYQKVRSGMLPHASLPTDEPDKLRNHIPNFLVQGAHER